MLPILHLNGYKIANPTILARMCHEQLRSLFIGYGYKPHFVEGSDPGPMHQLMARTLETVLAEIRTIQQNARTKGLTSCPEWPMIVLRTPKGWTGPKEIGGHKVEGSWRAPVSSLNILVSSTVWRQDHNGFSHPRNTYMAFRTTISIACSPKTNPSF